MILDPGRLRWRLSYETLVETPDGQGGFEAEWQHQFDVPAAIRPLSASAAERAGTREAAVSHEITLRFRDGIAAGGRFTKAGRAFEIVAVRDPDETGRYLVCDCREPK